MPSAGQVIGGRYRLEHCLGAGAMGAVWQALHLELDVPLAIKFEHTSPDGVQRPHASRREARAAARLRSANVVRILDFGTDDGSAYIAMELLVGESLKARLDVPTRLSPNEVGVIVHQAATGLDVAHAERIVHRDIKPSNLFLARENDRQVVKVLDFGIAKWLDAEVGGELRSESAKLVGSAAYMSPEQARGRSLDHRADIWALGVVAYEMLIGSRPFDGGNIPETLTLLCAGVHRKPSQCLGHDFAALDAVFARALQVDPERRYASAGAFASALVSAIAGLSEPERAPERQAPNVAPGRSSETASLRLDGAGAQRDRVPASRSRLVLLLSAAAGVIVAWVLVQTLRSPSTSGNLGTEPSASALATAAEVAPKTTAPPVASAVPALAVASAAATPVSSATSVAPLAVSAVLAEQPTSRATATRALDVPRAARSASPTPQPTTGSGAASASPSTVDPLFGLEVPAH